MSYIRWGVLGLGHIGQIFCQSIRPVTNATLLAVASKSRNIDSLKTSTQISAQYSFKNYLDLLNCDEVDAVYIALPNHLHMEWIQLCLEHGKHVLVEKPAVIHSAELLQIKNQLEFKNLIFSEAFMYIHHPRIEKLLNFINSGKIGKPVQMKTSWGFEIFRKPSLFKKTINFYKTKPSRFKIKHGGGCILDLGCYMTSLSYLIARIFSEKKEVPFSLENKTYTFANEEVEVDASTTINFANGFRSDIQCSFTTHLDETTFLFGEEGEIRIDDTWSCQSNGFWVNSKYFEIPNPSFENPYSFQIQKISENIALRNQGENINLKFGLNESFNNALILDSWRSPVLH